MAERNEISLHELKVYRLLKGCPESWLTNRQIAEETKIAERTVRCHTLRLVKLGVLDQAEIFPAHRYRLSRKADKRNRGYVERLEFAMEVVGEG